MHIRLAALGLALCAGSAISALEAQAAPARSTCRAVKDAVALVPGDAKAILHVAGPKTFRSRLYGDLRGAIERDLALKDGLELLDACGLAIQDLDELTAGVGDGDKTVAIIKAPGLGTNKTLGCLRDQIAARENGKRPWTSRRAGCYRVLSRAGKDFGFVLDDSTIVLSHEAWADQVRARIDGKGRAALEGTLAPTAARVDKTKSLWFVGALDDTDRDQLRGSSAADLRQVAGSIDLARGVDLSVLMQLSDPGGARQLKDELATYRDMIAGLGMFPTAITDGIRIDSRGHEVTMSLALSFADLEQVRKALEPHTRGKNPL